jgi:hypothetical protein
VPIRVTVPELPALKVAVVETSPVALVTAVGGLKVTVPVPPLAENVTVWPAPPRKWAVNVRVPPATTVVVLVAQLAPGVPT